jgi:hypothetical protein
VQLQSSQPAKVLHGDRAFELRLFSGMARAPSAPKQTLIIAQSSLAMSSLNGRSFSGFVESPNILEAEHST